MKTLLLFITIFVCNSILLAQGLPVIAETENADMGSDYEVLTENEIRFVRPQTNLLDGSMPGDISKILTFNLHFAEKGEYHFYAKVRVGSDTYDDDSFYFSKNFGLNDAANPDHWHLVNGIVPVGSSNPDEIVSGTGSVGNLVWKWINISQFLNIENPVIFTVDNTNDSLMFSIGAREDGLDIDKIAFGKANLFYTVSNFENIEPGSNNMPVDENGFPLEAYTQVKTFVNPIMPGDHPDLTLFKDGDDFYSCGSNFHFAPYLPILHSTDLVHWEEICRVIPVSWDGILSDEPQAGTWAGVITYFYDSYWIYFSNTAGGGQYFCKANHPAGPWTLPVKMRTTSSTGPVGYDNSIFIDDDGTPYMLTKNGERINRMQEIGTDGHLINEALNLDFINADGRYSWAEGPVMCKRNGWYYYFIAGNVAGGQYVLRTPELTDNPESWEELGDFFENVTDPLVTFRSPNHIAQPFQLDDGTWWTISHSYENRSGNDWSGQGRQGLLHQITWDVNGKPTGKAPTSTPQLKPNLPKSGIPWKTPRSDSFENDDIELSWHFMNRKAATQYSLVEKPGWLTLLPGIGSTHILHKETRHHNAIVTKIDFDAENSSHQAGIYFTNGNQSVTAEVYSGYNNGKKLGIRFGTQVFEIDNLLGNELWLKAQRENHLLRGFYSSNGIAWTQIGDAINVTNLDKSQENWNWWVGTSNGLFAKGKKAHFDYYAFKDGFSPIQSINYTNYFGLESKGSGSNRAMTNSTENGGWLMLAGVDLGENERVPTAIELEVFSENGGILEVWIDDLEAGGTKIATIDIAPTSSESDWEKVKATVNNISGQHDVYLRWNGVANAFFVKTVQFIAHESFYTGFHQMQKTIQWKVYPNPFKQGFIINTNNMSISYSIFTLEGKIVETGKSIGVSKILGKDLRPGLYILHLNSGRNIESVKLIKTK
jgi:beta-xylosidase